MLSKFSIFCQNGGLTILASWGIMGYRYPILPHVVIRQLLIFVRPYFAIKMCSLLSINAWKSDSYSLIGQVIVYKYQTIWIWKRKKDSCFVQTKIDMKCS